MKHPEKQNCYYGKSINVGKQEEEDVLQHAEIHCSTPLLTSLYGVVWFACWKRPVEGAETHPFISDSRICHCTEKSKRWNVPATDLKRVTPRCSATLSICMQDLLEPPTPSNKTSALLTEVRHCITHDWPQSRQHTRTHSYTHTSTNGFQQLSVRQGTKRRPLIHKTLQHSRATKEPQDRYTIEIICCARASL